MKRKHEIPEEMLSLLCKLETSDSYPLTLIFIRHLVKLPQHLERL
jgi:hypothetical protein